MPLHFDGSYRTNLCIYRLMDYALMARRLLAPGTGSVTLTTLSSTLKYLIMTTHLSLMWRTFPSHATCMVLPTGRVTPCLVEFMSKMIFKEQKPLS